MNSRERSNARSVANVNQRRGKLVPQACERCGDPDTVKHHDDYGKPLQVRWLCRRCHRDEHFPHLAQGGPVAAAIMSEPGLPRDEGAPPPRRCRICGSRGRVYDSRSHKGITRRRIRCDNGHRFTTVELFAPQKGKRADVEGVRKLVK